MLTVIETPTFTRLATDYWTDDDHGEFAAWIAQNPETGDVVPGSGGAARCVGHARAWVSVGACG